MRPNSLFLNTQKAISLLIKSAKKYIHTSLFIAVTALLVACNEKPSTPSIKDDDIALNNRGVALMGKFDYRAAVDVFSDLTERYSDSQDFRINLAIGLKNRQEPNDAHQALEHLKIVLEQNPDNVRANYISGVIELYLGRVAQASEYFESAIVQDPNDAYTHYYLGQCNLRSDNASGALEHYRSAIKLDPYLRSAYYSAAQVLRRMGNHDEADQQLSLFKKLEINPRARLAEFKYTRMGPMSLATVLGGDTGIVRQVSPPAGPLFTDKRLVANFENGSLIDNDANSPSLKYSLSSVDINNDGAQDLFFSDVENGLNKLIINAHENQNNVKQGEEFFVNSNHPWGEVDAINAIAWGDIDNNGRVDAYLCRTGANQLWTQADDGQWNLASDPHLADSNHDCSDATLIDADHDGDLDILVANRGANNNLINNNRDGSFRSLASNLHAVGPSNNTRHILTSDIDADSDVDLIFVNHHPPHNILINDRLWRYYKSNNYDELLNADLMSLAAADLDANGQTEFISIDSQGSVKLWFTDNTEQWRSEDLYQSALTDLNSVAIAAIDFSGNGQKEIALLSEGAFEIISLKHNANDSQWVARQEMIARYDGGRAIPIVNSLRGQSLVAIGKHNDQHGVFEWKPGSGRFEFVTLSLTGKHDAAETMRSNHSGIGSQVSVRTGTQWSRDNNLKNSGITGYSLQPLTVGLNGQNKADFIAIDWSDGVYQTELDVTSNAFQTIAEEQRQLGSCPVLFAFNGSKFDFVTDILGVAAQGFLVEPGTLMPPRPWERVAFSPGKLVSKDGRIMFKVTEPMEENSYIDSLHLESYDIPNDWHIVVDERMGTGAPDVTGDVLFFKNSISPVRAFNSTGTDVLKSILKHDQTAMPPGDIDRHYIGLLKEPESLVIEFDQAIDKQSTNYDGLPVLMAENWVELPYSQTHFAAWQAGRQYRAISLEARDQSGHWKMIYPEFGMPGGMPRTMSLPLHALPKGSNALRLSWNREIYWDQIRIVYAQSAPEQMNARVLKPSLARVSKSGFYQRVTHAQRRPEYIYQNRRTFSDVRYPTGFYTNLGEMTDLVNNSDDALAIIGPGEEIHVEFETPEPPQNGFKRWYVLDVRGWAKDSDTYTYQGDTVGPLPRTYPERNDQRRDQLHQKYNVRFQSGM